MHGDSRVDQVTAKGPKASEDSIFIRTREPRIADDVGHQDRRELSCLAHGAGAEVRSPVADGTSMAALPCCTEETWKRSAAPRVDWPAYPRRAEHNTVAEGGNTRWAEIARKTRWACRTGR